jgi:hypothetical protein
MSEHQQNSRTLMTSDGMGLPSRETLTSLLWRLSVALESYAPPTRWPRGAGPVQDMVLCPKEDLAQAKAIILFLLNQRPIPDALD